jgi:hypothetical protein
MCGAICRQGNSVVPAQRLIELAARCDHGPSDCKGERLVERMKAKDDVMSDPLHQRLWSIHEFLRDRLKDAENEAAKRVAADVRPRWWSLPRQFPERSPI